MGSFQYGSLVERITTSSSSTVTLVNITQQNIVLTGSNQTLVLPSATTMGVGQFFNIYNQSTSVVTIEFNGGAAFTDAAGNSYGSLAPGKSLTVTLQTNGTSAGTWAVTASGSGGLTAWTASNPYTAGSVVLDGKQAYVALENFTSGSTFGADLVNGYWQLLNLPVTGRNYALTGNNFEDNTVGGWQVFALQTQVTFTVSALSSSIPVGAVFTNNSQTFTVTSTAASGATTLITSATGLPTSGATTLTSSTYTFTVSALSNAVPVGATYTNNSQTFTVIVAAASGATSLITSGTGAPTSTGTLTWGSGTLTNLTSIPGNITFSAETSNINGSSPSVTVSSSSFATFSAGNIPVTLPTYGAAFSMTAGLSSSGNAISGQYSLLVSNTSTDNLSAGQGIISEIYNIDKVDQAKVMQIVSSYMASGSNASTMNFSGTNSNTWAVYILDLTNNAWIQPAGVYNFVQNTTTLPGRLTATWQTPSNMTSFRIAILCINSTTASSPAVNTIQTYFDDFYVGPQTAPTGPAMTDFGNIPWTPTGSWTSNVTYAGKYKRIGDTLYADVTVSLSGAPNSANLAVNLPPGLSIDTTKLSASSPSGGQSSYGWGVAVRNGVSSFPLIVTYNSTTSVLAQAFNASGTYATENGVTQAVPATFANTDTVQLYFTVPVVGWSSNTAMSSDTDTRVVAMQETQAVPTATITSSDSLLKFTATPISDTHGGFSTSTGLYTVPVSGYYKVASGINVTGTFAAGNVTRLSFFKNGSQVNGSQNVFVMSGAITTVVVQTVGTILCSAGDTLGPYVSSSGTSPAVGNNSSTNFFNVERLSGPAVVAATESVNARYSFIGNTALPSGILETLSSTYATYTKIKDTHAAFNISTGVYTVPVAGTYRVTLRGSILSASATTGIMQANITQSGSATIQSNNNAPIAAASQLGSSQVTDDFNCLAGDTLTLMWGQNNGSSIALSNSAGYNSFSIERVGN